MDRKEKMYIASCLMGEQLFKYQKIDIQNILKGICFFGIANGNNPYFDCSLNGDNNRTYQIAKYVSNFRPVIVSLKNLRYSYLLFRHNAIRVS